jgi:hypothetical protein
MGAPYAEPPRTTTAPGPIPTQIGRNLTCSKPVQSLDLLWGGPILTVPSKTTHWGSTNTPATHESYTQKHTYALKA